MRHPQLALEVIPPLLDVHPDRAGLLTQLEHVHALLQPLLTPRDLFGADGERVGLEEGPDELDDEQALRFAQLGAGLLLGDWKKKFVYARF